MPCYTRQTSTVEFGANTDVKLLKLALEGKGYRVTQAGNELSFHSYATDGTFREGKLSVTSNEEFDHAALKNAYSVESVKFAAARFGWKVAQSGGKLHLQRRS